MKLLILGLGLFLFVIAIRWYLRELSGENYYAKYPGAKLIDDAARLGKLSPGSVDSIIQRIGAADDVKAEVAAMRSEMDVR